MIIRIKPTILSMALLSAFPVWAQTGLEPMTVTATRTAYQDVDAPYASEIHTAAMIEKSGARSLFDYLAQNSSLVVAPNYGNRAMPLIDMRGYGTESGNQNVVISVDGRRLNTIDMQPQLLGAIPLGAIDRIEITKGSGSVMYGDGAMAGTIQIYTRPYNGGVATAYAGTQGAWGSSLGAGISRDNFSAALTADRSYHGGFSKPGPDGSKDRSDNESYSGKISVRPFESLWLHLDASNAQVDTRYPNNLTLAQFDADPRQSGGLIYTHGTVSVEQHRAGIEYALNDAIKLTASHNEETKKSQSVAWWGGYAADYATATTDAALAYKSEALDLSIGVQDTDGSRSSGSSRTSKNNLGYYAQAAYRLGSLMLAAGGRRESVKYEYLSGAGVRTDGSYMLSAWDLGLNYRINDAYTAFGNINRAFQAPDVDRFFTFLGTFNGFIKPSEARTVTIGLSRLVPGNKFKVSAFHAALNDEIYFEPFGFNNTNLDKSHKYGLEVQQYWKAAANLYLKGNYTYTRAIIDQEIIGGQDLSGKDLPGVSRHTANVGLTYALNGKSDLSITHSWRSRSYALGDFGNDRAQKQAAYNATDLAYSHRFEQFELFAAVQNLFDKKNGFWTRDDAIYPINYSRSAQLGLKVNF